MQINKAMPDTDHAYSEWINTYSSDDYMEMPAKVERIIDTAGLKVPYGALPSHSKRCSLHEMAALDWAPSDVSRFHPSGGRCETVPFCQAFR